MRSGVNYQNNLDAINNNDYKLEKLFFDTSGENLHLQFCRDMLGVANKTVLQLLLENWSVTHCFTQMIKYWHHIRTEVDHDTFIYKILSLLQEREAKGQHNWLSSVTFDGGGDGDGGYMVEPQ